MLFSAPGEKRCVLCQVVPLPQRQHHQRPQALSVIRGTALVFGQEPLESGTPKRTERQEPGLIEQQVLRQLPAHLFAGIVPRHLRHARASDRPPRV